jgi:hypothetical protein
MKKMILDRQTRFSYALRRMTSALDVFVDNELATCSISSIEELCDDHEGGRSRQKEEQQQQ